MALVRLSIRISPSPFSFRPSPRLFNAPRVEAAQRLLIRPSCSFSTSSDTAASSSSDEKSSEVAVSKKASPPSRQDRRGSQLWKQPWNISPFHLNDGVGSFGNALMNLSENLNNLLRNWSPSRLFSRMKEHDDYYKFKIPVPGLSKEDLKVTVDDRYLVITGEHKEEEGGSDVDEIDGWYSQSFGYYNTSLLLPDDAKVDEIKAEVKNGVLHVTIPRSGEGRKNVREVEIQ